MARLTSAEYAKTHGAKAAKELHAEREARTTKINRRIAENQVMHRLKPVDAAAGSRLVNAVIDRRKPVSLKGGQIPPGGFSRFDKVNLRYRAGGLSDRYKNWTADGWEANSLINRHKVGGYGDLLKSPDTHDASIPKRVPSKPYSAEDKLLMAILKQTGGHSQQYHDAQILKGIKNDMKQYR